MERKDKNTTKRYEPELEELARPGGYALWRPREGVIETGKLRFWSENLGVDR